MKRILVASFGLLLASLGSANARGFASSLFPVPSGTEQAQKTIKDPAEYNAYISALNTTDAPARAAAMEAFAAQYPHSVVLIDALEQAMAAYQQAKNLSGVEKTARKILVVDPSNMRSLTVLTALMRAKATSGDAASLQETCSTSRKAIEALPNTPRPEGMSDADFSAMRNQVAAVLYGAAGFCAMQSKDFASARDNYLKVIELDPGDLQDTYQLAIADLEMKPMDVTGLWYCVKAINLANASQNLAGANSIRGYCNAKYRKYHGSEEGWDKLVASISAQEKAPPAGFAVMVKAAPTPSEIACKAVEENKPEDLSFSDDEFILQHRDDAPCNKEAADKVWASIQAMQKQGAAKLEIEVKVISATEDTLHAAMTDENQSANTADLQVTMAKKMLRPPAAGAKVKVIGVMKEYKLNPFIFIMEKGELSATAAAARK